MASPTSYDVHALDVTQSADAEVYKLFIGTWLNNKMESTHADHAIEDFLYTTSARADAEWAVKVLKSWSDARGGTCCQFTWNYTRGWRKDEAWRRGVGLMRVDKEGKVWESNLRWGVDEKFLPQKIDMTARTYEDHYFVYYRQ